MPEPGRSPQQGCQGERPSLAASVDLKKLRSARTAALVLGGLGCIVAGIWVIAAALFGAAIGAGAGLVVMGPALLLTEWVSR